MRLFKILLLPLDFVIIVLMKSLNKNFDKYFNNNDALLEKEFSFSIIKTLIRSILEPIISNKDKAVIFTRLKDIPEIKSLTKRIEFDKNIILKEFSDFELSKNDIEELGFIVLTSKRYNCAFLFKPKEEGRYQIFFKMNSKLVSNVYETLKEIFSINYDKDFYEYKPERRENDLMNKAIFNILNHFEETIVENECNLKIQESYKNVNETNTTLRNEIYQNVRQIAHEIKNQLSILDIYTRIFEKKTGDSQTTIPIKKSIALIKSQIEQFKNIDVINLQERDVKAVINEAIKVYEGLLKEKNNTVILIDKMPSVEARAFIDEEKFLIVIGNVIKNANDCTKDDEIIVELNKIQDNINIKIINHGEKIKDEDKPKIFESGYTTKKDGWGVGLSVCKKFIGSQFGTFELAKSDENETIFSLNIPMVQKG